MRRGRPFFRYYNRPHGTGDAGYKKGETIAIKPNLMSCFFYDHSGRTSGSVDKMFKYGDDYLHEAALANNPPSGTYYAPNNDHVRLESLGTHEHWNNPTVRRYSRNPSPKKGKGIELITSEPKQARCALGRYRSRPIRHGRRLSWPMPFAGNRDGVTCGREARRTL